MQEIEKYSDVRNSFNGINVLENTGHGIPIIVEKYGKERPLRRMA